MLTISREYLSEDGLPDGVQLTKLLLQQRELCERRLNALHEYYERSHAIKTRRRLKGLPNNRLPHDLPGYIVAVASGYLVGEPIHYEPPESCDDVSWQELMDAMSRSDSASVDAELATDAGVYGKGVELCYADKQANPRLAQVDPRRAFVVYDDTVEHKALFGVMTVPHFNRLLEPDGESVHVYTATQCVSYYRKSSETPVETGRQSHFFGGVPMTEFWNNAREEGDFEGVLELIDAYDALQSDRVNDKQQFTDAVMVLKGVGALGVDDTEETRPGDGEEDGEARIATSEEREATPASVRLRQTRTLFLPGQDADAQFITKPDAESGNEVLRSSICDDIHKLSFVPDLTDEKFAGDTSGVAMRFKLFGLEQMVKIKERWFREAVRSRLRLLTCFLALRGSRIIDAEGVQITFTRSLPVNDLEIAQTASTLDGIVSDKTILKHIPWVDDPEAEAEAIAKQKADDAAQAMQRMQGLAKQDGADEFAGDAGQEDEP